MPRTKIAGMLLLALAGGAFAYAQDLPPKITSVDIEIARYTGGRQLFGSFFGSWATPVPFDPSTQLAKELDEIHVTLHVLDLKLQQDTTDANAPVVAPPITIKYYEQIRGFELTFPPPPAPPLTGATLNYVLQPTPDFDQADPNFTTVLIDAFIQVPEFNGVSQARLRGQRNFDVAWGVDICVANSESPDQAGFDCTGFTLKAVENTALLPPNPPPVADAGGGSTVTAGTTVKLNGSRSFDGANIGFNPLDPNVFAKDTLRYTWEWISGPDPNAPLIVPDPCDPANALVTLTTVTPADQPYVFRLSVSDQYNALPATAVVQIFVAPASARNRAPHAVITAPAGAIAIGGTIQLSGTASTDPDGNTLTYRWRQTNSLGGDLQSDEIQAAFQPLDGLDAAVTRWQAISTGTFYFTLVVTDPAGLSDMAGPAAVTVVASSSGATAQSNAPAQQRDLSASPTTGTTHSTGGCGAGGLLPLALLPGLLWVMRRR